MLDKKQQEVEDEIDIQSAKAKKKYHKGVEKAKEVIEDEKGQTSLLGIIVFLIIIFILLRILGIL